MGHNSLRRTSLSDISTPAELVMTTKYNKSDYTVIANNIHRRLCELDKSDRNLGIDPKWHDLIQLVKKVNAYSDKMDIWYLVVHILKSKNKLIETDKSSFKVKLTKKGKKGRGLCDKWLKITEKDKMVPIQHHKIRFET